MDVLILVRSSTEPVEKRIDTSFWVVCLTVIVGKFVNFVISIIKSFTSTEGKVHKENFYNPWKNF